MSNGLLPLIRPTIRSYISLPPATMPNMLPTESCSSFLPALSGVMSPFSSS